MTEWIRAQGGMTWERKSGGSFVLLVRDDLSSHTVQQNLLVVSCHT